MSSDLGRFFSGRGLLVTAAATAVLLGGVTACGSDDEVVAQTGATGAGPATGATGAASPGEQQPSARPSENDVTLVQAAAAALKKVPGKIDEIERDDGGWEVEILTKNGKWRDVRVNAEGKVVSNKADDDDDDDRDDAAALRKARVTASKAAEAVLKIAPGAVTSVDFEDDDGRHWEVEITDEDGNEREFEVNASSGDVRSDDD